MVFDHLLYRHWDALYGGEAEPCAGGVGERTASDVRDLTPASAVGDAETPTFSLGGPIGYAWAPDSKEIAYVTNLDTVPGGDARITMCLRCGWMSRGRRR